MEPIFLQECLSREDRPKEKTTKPRNVTWICLPYFCLEEYSGGHSASKPNAHPMRTLLQARSSLARKERDMQQAVCSVLNNPPEFCFHIPQIWCLVLDDCRHSLAMCPFSDADRLSSLGHLCAQTHIYPQRRFNISRRDARIV
jgi:hypothetical protein